MQLRLGKEEIKTDDPNKEYMIDDISGKISVLWDIDKAKNYTILFYDVDAPYPPPRNEMSPYMLYLETNTPGKNINKGTIYFSYVEPEIPGNSPAHTYFVDIYEEVESVNVSSFPKKRENFNVKDF